MSEEKSINYAAAGADLMAAFENVMKLIDARVRDRLLYHLVLLRASQINRCGFCVKMHTREAREDGETNERLDQLIIWRHSSAFSDAEKAAFAWTEALTRNGDHAEISGLRSALRAFFSDEEIATLTSTIVMINVWNRFHISNY